MTKFADLIRHGQSTFNAAYLEQGEDPQEVDARLTELGRRQVAETRAMLAQRHYDLIVASPLTRALETARGLFTGREVGILVEALHRERVEHACDHGRSPKVLAREFPDLDFDNLDDPWWHTEGGKGVAFEPDAVLAERVARFRRWLLERPERRIAVVGHGTFFRHLSGQSFQNCEVVRLELVAAG